MRISLSFRRSSSFRELADKWLKMKRVQKDLNQNFGGSWDLQTNVRKGAIEILSYDDDQQCASRVAKALIDKDQRESHT